MTATLETVEVVVADQEKPVAILVYTAPCPATLHDAEWSSVLIAEGNGHSAYRARTVTLAECPCPPR